MKIKEGIDSYSLKILTETGDVIRTYSGKGKVRESIKWDGLTDSGKRLPDGNYKALLAVLYKNGNSPKASSRLFLLDTEYPEIEAKPDLTLFSPDRDGKKDSVRFIQNSSSEALWQGKIHDDAEVLLLIKTDRNHFTALSDIITQMHPYEVPEIIGVPLEAGYQPYLEWMDACLKDS